LAVALDLTIRRERTEPRIVTVGPGAGLGQKHIGRKSTSERYVLTRPRMKKESKDQWDTAKGKSGETTKRRKKLK
jgi:K+-transporting ATPase c subunit